jgi:hypothetical protein
MERDLQCFFADEFAHQLNSPFHLALHPSIADTPGMCNAILNSKVNYPSKELTSFTAMPAQKRIHDPLPFSFGQR